MGESEIEGVLQNWIEQAIAPVGQLADNTDAATWVTQHFTAWWRSQAGDSLEFAELSASRLREELHNAQVEGGFDEVLQELTHLQDALADLRRQLGMNRDGDHGS